MKKSILLVALSLAFVANFSGCNKSESVETPVASEPASSSEVASEEVSSEEVSEEASSEEVASEYYSAEEIMKLIDELTAKYTYDDPEFIKSLVIAANLDYITDEDLATLLSTYGYTIEELNAIYKSEQGIGATFISYEDSRRIFAGEIEYSETTDYSKKMPLYEVMLNETDKEYATEFYNHSLKFAGNDDYASSEDVSTSGKITTKSFAYLFNNFSFSSTAYENYLNQNAN